MQIDKLNTWHNLFKESQLYGRYIHTDTIHPLLKILQDKVDVDIIGQSVNGNNIEVVTLGTGSKKILIWSQMHGNESTTTKALFDVFNFLNGDLEISETILSNCTIKVVPLLNPDGAKAYTRLNANGIDLNRDARDLSQPESIALRSLFDAFKPDFCFNLHGQRTIFSAGSTDFPASVSFLAPAQNELCTITDNRKQAMELISVMNANLQLQIPNQVGIYDDTFNINCVGDMFQTFNIPTVLFEAGHIPGDYSREITRKYIFHSLIVAFNYIAISEIIGDRYHSYFEIPKNEKLFYDVIIRNAKYNDIAIQYHETLEDQSIFFMPKIEKIGDLNNFYSHKELNANGHAVLSADKKDFEVGNEIDFVIINNEKFSVIL